MKTVRAVLWSLTAVLVVLFVADRAVSRFGGAKPYYPRSIRLRELPPNLDFVKDIPEDVLAASDGLGKTRFHVRTDSQGFLKPSFLHEKPDLTIFFLGGSSTECLYLEEENRFPYLTGRLLEQQTHLKINSVNSGVSGNHSMHSNLLLLGKILPLNPDIVVLHHNINDLQVLLLTGSYWNESDSRSIILQHSKLFSKEMMLFVRYWLYPNLFEWALSVRFTERLMPFTYRRSLDEFAYLRGKKVRIEDEHLIKEFTLSLRTFIAICRARGIEPVLMTQANRIVASSEKIVTHLANLMGTDYGIDYEHYRQLYNRFNDSIRLIGKEQKVLVIDMDRAIPKSKTHLSDCIHYNDVGSRYASAVIAQAIASADFFQKRWLKSQHRQTTP